MVGTILTSITSDLIEEILSRVPATTLVEKKVGIRHWEALIKDPRFVNKHLSHLHGRDHGQLTVFNDICPAAPSSGSAVSCLGIDFNVPDQPCLGVKLFNPLDLSVISMSHCDGLLLYVMRSKLLVMNPLLKQGRWVDCGDGFDHEMDACGLGYISNQPSSSSSSASAATPLYEYMMVRFSCALESRKNRVAKIEVYSFKNDYWKNVGAGSDSFAGFNGLPLSSVCWRGTPYWIGHLFSTSVPFAIQSFDFSKEKFESLSLPPSGYQRTDTFSLGLFRGDHLSLLHKSGFTGRIDIWVMIEDCWYWHVSVTKPELSMYHIYSGYLIEENRKLVLFGRPFDTASISIFILGENGDEERRLAYSSGKNHTRGTCYYVPSLLQVPGFLGREEEEEEGGGEENEAAGSEVNH